MYRSVVISVSLVFVVFTILLYIASALPQPTGRFVLEQGQVVYHHNTQRDTVAYFRLGEQLLEANPDWLVEEPDVLSSYAHMNEVFAAHTQLYDASTANRLQLITDKGTVIPVVLTARTLKDLPGLFWFQSICALCALLICTLVWIPSRKDVAVNAFCLTGLGYALSASTAAIYSTRALFIDGQWFLWLSRLNSLGTILFVTFLAIFLWHYPNTHPRKPIMAAIFSGLCVQLFLHFGQWLPSPAEGLYAWVMVLFIFGLIGSAWQWHGTRAHPAERVVLTWVLLSILSGTLFFTGGMIIPVLLRTAKSSDQALLLGTFLFMYFGMMFAVIRYRLFDIQRWSFAIWSWLLGGLAVLVCDFVLISLLTINSETSLAIALALVGWLYFPLRQWVWSRLFNRQHKGLDNWLKQTLPRLLSHDYDVNMTSPLELPHPNQQLVGALEAVFQPLHLSILPEKHLTHLSSTAETLWVALPSGNSVCMQHAQGGRRIFNRDDIETVRLILALDALIAEISTAKQVGAMEERDRIRRDIHDDLGAKLLRLLHLSSGDTQALVREAIRDLRRLIAGQHLLRMPLRDLIDHCHIEIKQRCFERDIPLTWHDKLDGNPLISGNKQEHLALMIRESVSNALRATETQWLSLSITQVDSQLTILIENNTNVTMQQITWGNGLKNLQSRAKVLDGECEIHVVSGVWQVRISLPLS